MYELLDQQQGLFLYIGLFVALMGGAIGLPIPEDLPLIAAGIAIHNGVAKPLPVFIICYVSIIIGDVIIYSIGRKFGPAIFNSAWFQKRFPPRRLKKVKFGLERRSLVMIFLARHLFYLRTLTFLACGAVKMSLRRFIIVDACAALVSAPLVISLGYLFAEQAPGMIGSVKRVEVLFLIVLLLAIGYWFLKRRMGPKVDQMVGEENSEE